MEILPKQGEKITGPDITIFGTLWGVLQDERRDIYIFELRKNPGLKANVISMYKSYFQSEGFFRPRIAENVTISGKLKEHTVDIYFEFIQMNNLESGSKKDSSKSDIIHFVEE